MISMWVWSGQSFPPLLAPEAALIFSNNGILTIYSNYRATSPTGSVSGKRGNGLITVVTMGCTSERVLSYIVHDYLMF